MEIVNLTQHPASADQRSSGVVEPKDKSVIKTLLTFEELPTSGEIRERAQQVASAAAGYKCAMIGGAPFFMSALEAALKDRGVTPVYAFSRRESVEETAADGSTVKRNVFRHLGFVEIL